MKDIKKINKLKKKIEDSMSRRHQIQIMIEKLRNENRELSGVVAYAEDDIDRLETELANEKNA